LHSGINGAQGAKVKQNEKETEVEKKVVLDGFCDLKERSCRKRASVVSREVGCKHKKIEKRCFPVFNYLAEEQESPK
jgi:hypothetical protein